MEEEEDGRPELVECAVKECSEGSIRSVLERLSPEVAILTMDGHFSMA